MWEDKLKLAYRGYKRKTFGKNRKKTGRNSGSKTITGVFCANARGFGFISVDGEDADYFVPRSRTAGAFDKDIVEAVVSGRRRGESREAKVVRIIERGNIRVVGLYKKSGTGGFVIPDNEKIPGSIHVSPENKNGAASGQKVLVRIESYGLPKQSPEGVIEEILGREDDPGVDILSVIKAHDIPDKFPQEVLDEAFKIPESVPTGEINGRLDLRKTLTITIDGEDAKDLDDAVTLERKGGMYVLGVHIADVSHYVKEGSRLDKEALKRGTSVYPVDRVVPMLPERLSNGICSLNEGEDRLCLSCIMKIDDDGNVKEHSIRESVINSDRRMTYTAVRGIIEGKNQKLLNEYADIVPMVNLMAQLSDKVREKRRRRGSIDFDLAESRITLDENGRAIDVAPAGRTKANDIIEDFMLLANETVARDFFEREIPFVYRTHDKPDEEKIRELFEFARGVGIRAKATDAGADPGTIQRLLDKAQETPAAAVVKEMALRSMKQARYSEENTGHFGLAAKYYCHFTSPIRRYPDLLIHRIIKETLSGRMDGRRIEHYRAITADAAKKSSAAERRSVETERECESIKKAEYMQGRVGEKYSGIISSVTKWGVYVTLENSVEGMIRTDDLSDRFIFDEKKMMLSGRSSGERFMPGRKIDVIVQNADKRSGKVDFIPA